MLVHQILKGKPDDGVVTISPSMKVQEAAELLSSRKIGAVIVSEDGKMALGILSERDIVRELGRRGTACLRDEVSDMMTTELVFCARDDTADAVMSKMTEGRFRHMPVQEAGLMIGLISIGDVVKARLSELSMEKDALQGMIMGH
ncbi:Inosine-5'-monophosphate dehydrogenase [Candidatus Rhodobacter oscarellae]|uniref:Inosine-5'-monophosphate dehydrogenase n=1 Tax=Candidatus Rhodobacter oscarellae TaxID=1675527 RepID=A0A0J9E109_9RHOB|nr:CBS domain-containing protein [Candidatus Rhodobacter lobularis]KMW56601.1 Inosine-5'-monophosphate dehydrogenase [Candidatus Rhodobacter lobularis]